MTFWIFDFRFSIETQENKPMNAMPSQSLSDNPKSAIENRKWLELAVIAVVLVMAGAVAQAQQPAKIPRIGFLSTTFPANVPTRLEAFRQGLRDLGYVEGEKHFD